ncbi:hypothetical protein BT69DRAFT_1210847, partial [Atractiella rhizophila]
KGRGVDLLFGLDMLKRHQAIIDLQQNALIIQDVKVPFLSEHELPSSALDENAELEDLNNPNSSSSQSQPQASTSSSSTAQSTSFPGAGQALGGGTGGQSSGAGGSTGGFPEDKIQALVNLGVKREEAIKLLEQTAGDAEMAASLLFSQFN